MTGVQTCALPICFPVTIASLASNGGSESRSSVNSSSSSSSNNDIGKVNPYKYFKAQAKRFTMKVGDKMQVGMTEVDAEYTLKYAYPGLMNQNDLTSLKSFVEVEDQLPKRRAELVFLYLMTAAAQKLLLKDLQDNRL